MLIPEIAIVVKNGSIISVVSESRSRPYRIIDLDNHRRNDYEMDMEYVDIKRYTKEIMEE